MHWPKIQFLPRSIWAQQHYSKPNRPDIKWQLSEKMLHAWDHGKGVYVPWQPPTRKKGLGRDNIYGMSLTLATANDKNYLYKHFQLFQVLHIHYLFVILTMALW